MQILPPTEEETPLRRMSMSEMYQRFMDIVILLIWPAILIAFVSALAVVVTACYWITVIIIVESAKIVDLLLT